MRSVILNEAMAKTKKQTSLYEYLNQTGVLETGDDELIGKVKAAYWRKYHKDYKQEKRKKDKEYSISLSKTERTYLEKEASKYSKSMSMFIKDSAWAYIHCEYLNPQKADILKIQQLLSRCYSNIERLSDSYADPIEIQKALDAVMKIEENINRLFERPIFA